MHDVTFTGHNVLADEELRQGIKEFSNWPTIPQVYLEGEFIGGCDIMLQMHQSGELIEELGKVGIKSALASETEEK
jgi:monothiol glutaredoxin